VAPIVFPWRDEIEGKAGAAAAAHFGCCVLSVVCCVLGVVVVVVMSPFSYLTGRNARSGQPKWPIYPHS
jgi:hypothetical protein